MPGKWDSSSLQVPKINGVAGLFLHAPGATSPASVATDWVQDEESQAAIS